MLERFPHVYKLVIEYDGTDYYGWQIQPDRRTVQGELISACSRFIKGNFRLNGAARTDRGVHAEGQVASLHLEYAMEPEELMGILNELLPRDIYIKSVMKMPSDFHARWKAKGKLYRYRILEGRSPLRRRYIWEIKERINYELLNISAKLIKGKHNFKELSTDKEHRQTEIEVELSYWKIEGDELHYYIKAPFFLNKMVRVLVGMMVKVALKRGELFEINEAFRGRRPHLWIAPPQGLSLVRVFY